jgi:hypothetical protein
MVEGAGRSKPSPSSLEAADRAPFDLANVHHLLFWRQVTLGLARGEPRPDAAETKRRDPEG